MWLSLMFKGFTTRKDSPINFKMALRRGDWEANKIMRLLGIIKTDDHSNDSKKIKNYFEPESQNHYPKVRYEGRIKTQSKTPDEQIMKKPSGYQKSQQFTNITAQNPAQNDQ